MISYILINPMGTDNGKLFSELNEAVSYLYKILVHQKMHMDASLVQMEVAKDKFIVKIESYDYFKGRTIHELGIKLVSKKKEKDMVPTFEYIKEAASRSSCPYGEYEIILLLAHKMGKGELADKLVQQNKTPKEIYDILFKLNKIFVRLLKQVGL